MRAPIVYEFRSTDRGLADALALIMAQPADGEMRRVLDARMCDEIASVCATASVHARRAGDEVGSRRWWDAFHAAIEAGKQ